MLLILLSCSENKEPTVETDSPQSEEIPNSCAETSNVLSVSSSSGCVVGTPSEGAEHFLGIPYAQAPIGELRWKRPQPVESWEGDYHASEVGEICPQNVGGILYGSEDCLSLNILRPEGTQPGDNLPVLFFTHGGSYLYGAGSQEMFVQNAQLATKAIVVTHNYRLGALGFLAHPLLSDEDASAYGGSGTSGNQGLFDTLLALEWTKTNIEAFGGSPDQLMVLGESAGGITTCALLGSGLTEGLFSSALIQSAGCMWVSRPLKEADLDGLSAEDLGVQIAQSLGCQGAEDELACMRATSTAEIAQATRENSSFMPNVDGVFIPDALAQLFWSGDFQQVPIFAGVTENEGSLFVREEAITTPEELDERLEQWGSWMGIADLETFKTLYSYERYGDYQLAYDHMYGDLIFACPLRFFLEQTSYHVPTRAYHFTHVPSWNEFYGQDGWGAYHSSELSFIFGTFSEYLTPEENALSERMQLHWITAAQITSTETIEDWPLFEQSEVWEGGNWLEIATEQSSVVSGVNQEECDFFATQWYQ